MVKKAFIKTVEVLLAVILTAIIMLVVIPKHNSINRERQEYLSSLVHDGEFRAFASAQSICTNSTDIETERYVRRYLPKEYDYYFCRGAFPNELPNRNVYLDSIFFAGNYTVLNFKTLRLYYFAK
jgi:hypothetical protein